ncbi:hypothetical protein SAVIM40S_07416 [Streptomyces avidinii]
MQFALVVAVHGARFATCPDHGSLTRPQVPDGAHRPICGSVEAVLDECFPVSH